LRARLDLARGGSLNGIRNVCVGAVAVLQPVAAAGDRDQFAVVQESVEDRCGAG